VIDAFANGWPVRPGCRAVSIRFGPQSDVNAGYLVGGIACLALLVIFVLGLRRRRPLGAGTAPPECRDAVSGISIVLGRTRRYRPAQILIIALVGAGASALLLGPTAGVITGAAFAVILWRGIPSDTLIAAAGIVMLIAVPLYYSLFTVTNSHGYDPIYAQRHTTGHWLTAAAVALLALALALEMIADRARPSVSA
jgi:hypothetical protein